MRRLLLIERCKSGEISGEEYERKCEEYPWLRANVETKINDTGEARQPGQFKRRNRK